MGSTSCPECGNSFSRHDNMQRHRRQMHRPDTPPPPPQLLPYTPPPPPPPQLLPYTPPPPPQRSLSATQLATSGLPAEQYGEPFKFTIPSNAVFVGPSGCGKTMFMYQILQKGLIKPTPNNIIWCYTEWQPLYHTIRERMPQVQFEKGIPYNLQDDDFFNARNNNVLILDDHMTEAKDDKRISQLFTRTSHHKNVTNFLLLQNLFPRGKESRDIALNSHYVTLFNSPIDRQQVNLFARRIYPSNSDRFMSVYETAVQKPYGNLTIDLRPSTHENNRLKPNILDIPARIQQLQSTQPTDHGIKRNSNTLKDVSSPPDSQIPSDTRAVDTVKSFSETGSNLGQEEYTDEDLGESGDETGSFIMATACTDCGVLFGNMTDLQRHIKTWCPENELVQPRKRTKYHDEDTNSHDIFNSQKGDGKHMFDKRDHDLTIEWQNVGLQRVWGRVRANHLEDMKLRRKKYQQQGKTQEWIERKLARLWEHELVKTLIVIIEFTKYFSKAPLFRFIFDSLNKTDPNTDHTVIKDKIKLLLKPIMKDIIPHVDLTEEEESESESNHSDLSEMSEPE